MASTVEQPQPTDTIQPAESQPSRDPVMDVTLYERVTSLLLALILMLGGVSAGLGAMWASNHIAKPIATLGPITTMPDVFEYELGGGDPSGDPSGDIQLAGPEGEAPSAAEDSDRPSADAVALEATIAELVTRVGDASEMAEQLVVDLPTGLAIGRRGTNNSRILGLGIGERGGTQCADRWEIVFEKGLTEVEYARQIDFLQVELGVVVDGKLYRFSQVSSPTPAVRVTEPRAAKDEVMLIWRDERRRQVDVGLVRKANGVAIADSAVVLHFYPSATALKLAKLERDYATEHGKPDLKTVLKTRFGLKKTVAGYDFEIIGQRYFARYEGPNT